MCLYGNKPSVLFCSVNYKLNYTYCVVNEKNGIDNPALNILIKLCDMCVYKQPLNFEPSTNVIRSFLALFLCSHLQIQHNSERLFIYALTT